MSDVHTPTATDWAAFARTVVELVARGCSTAHLPLPPDSGIQHGGVFVTLHALGKLRGCMGVLDETRPLAQAVAEAATCAATRDPRFAPVSVAELPDLRVTVSILSRPVPMRALGELQIGRHGVLVRSGEQRGLFLPQVAAEHGLSAETFLSRCCTEKAGLPADAWRDGQAETLLFTTQVFEESR